MDYNELLHVSADVGSELLESGAETYRVEESVYRLVSAYGAREANVFAVPTCIIVSITLGDGSTVSKTRRIYARGTNLDRIDLLNATAGASAGGRSRWRRRTASWRQSAAWAAPRPRGGAQGMC